MMGLFRAANGWEEQKTPPPDLPKICRTYATMRKLGTAIVVAAMSPIMERPNAILKSEFGNISAFHISQKKR